MTENGGKSNILAMVHHQKLIDLSFQPTQMHLTSMSTTKKAILAQKLAQKLHFTPHFSQYWDFFTAL